MMKARYKASCAIAAILAGCGSAVHAADADATAATAPTGIQEIVVTAQRRNESLQKVPITVQAFTGETLTKLNITNLDDLLKYTPNVTYGNNGPGQGNIYRRGLSAGFAGDQSSAATGGFPNVAIYLDDQSMQFPGRNVDIYTVDMERVEVLEGPQGTLFGGGAEAGALRYITNKPKLNVFEGDVNASYSFQAHGDQSDSINGTVNIPVIPDKLAIRATIYNDREGGYIDNVRDTFTTLTGQVYNNYSIAHNAQNPTTYLGARIGILYQVNPDWDVLISESLQSLDAEGISAQEPFDNNGQTLGRLQEASYNPSYDKDKYENTAWTVNGKAGPLKLVYTGAYMERHISQQMDYSNYSRTGGGQYYQCTGPGTSFGGTKAICYSPLGYWQDTVTNTHLTNEVRVSSPDDWRFRFIVGGYYEQFRIFDNMNFDYKSIPTCTASNIGMDAITPCLANVGPAAGTATSDPNVRGDSTAFGEDLERGYDQVAVFGSFDFDIIPHVLTVTGGTRYFDYSEFEIGSEYFTTTGCADLLGECPPAASQANITNHHDQIDYHGFKSRGNITWHITPDVLVYYTFSQGFRPGAFNRTTGDVADLLPGNSPAAKASAQFDKPNGYAPDSLTNHEIGLKSELFEHRLQINLSAYYMFWDNVQFAFFNPTELGNTTFATNGPNYHIEGVEAQFVAKVTQGLTVQGSASYNDNRQSNSPCLVDNIPGTPAFGNCITTVKGTPFTNPYGTPGGVAAFSPEFQGNIRARYDWTVGAYNPYVMVAGSYTSSMYNEPGTYLPGSAYTNSVLPTTILRYYQPGYGVIDAALGVSTDRYTVELFGKNLANCGASTFTSSAQFIESMVPIRPRQVGLRVSAKF
jgi:outer membrane receptor protein involved in Fe transport